MSQPPLTRLSNDEGNDPPHCDNSDPYGPAENGVLLPVNRLLVEDLEHDCSRSDERVEDLQSKATICQLFAPLALVQ